MEEAAASHWSIRAARVNDPVLHARRRREAVPLKLKAMTTARTSEAINERRPRCWPPL